jgi:hypothetical protein
VSRSIAVSQVWSGGNGLWFEKRGKILQLIATPKMHM